MGLPAVDRDGCGVGVSEIDVDWWVVRELGRYMDSARLGIFRIFRLLCEVLGGIGLAIAIQRIYKPIFLVGLY